MIKFFKKFKKSFFGPFSNFEGKHFFLENPALSQTKSCGFLASFKNLGKTNDTVPRKRPERRILQFILSTLENNYVWIHRY